MISIKNPNSQKKIPSKSHLKSTISIINPTYIPSESHLNPLSNPSIPPPTIYQVTIRHQRCVSQRAQHGVCEPYGLCETWPEEVEVYPCKNPGGEIQENEVKLRNFGKKFGNPRSLHNGGVGWKNHGTKMEKTWGKQGKSLGKSILSRVRFFKGSIEGQTGKAEIYSCMHSPLLFGKIPQCSST